MNAVMLANAQMEAMTRVTGNGENPKILLRKKLKNSTRVSMVLSKWIITPIKVGCKSRKQVITQLTN